MSSNDTEAQNALTDDNLRYFRSVEVADDDEGGSEGGDEQALAASTDAADSEAEKDARVRDALRAKRDTRKDALGQSGPDLTRLANGLTVPPETIEALKELNVKHAFVNNGGKTRYAMEKPKARQLQDRITFMDEQTFNGLYSNRPHVRLEEHTANGVTNVYRPITKAWNAWPGRRTYVETGFFPAKASEGVEADVLNLWAGWGAEPKRGSWKRMLRHIWEVICRKDAKKFGWFLHWMANVVQSAGDPRGKTPVSPVIWGMKGSGKSSALEYLGEIFGRHFMTLSNREHLIGNFNYHLAMCLFIIAEEAIYAHDKQGEGILKDFLTRKRLTVTPKHVDTFETDNYCFAAFISNERLAVPMTEDERRFQPFQACPSRIGDYDYFEALHREMRDEGGIAAMMYDLQRIKVDRRLISFPIADSEDLINLKASAASAVSRFVAEWFAQGYVPDEYGNPPGGPGGMANGPALSGGDCLVLHEAERCQFTVEQLHKAYVRWSKVSLNRHEQVRAVEGVSKLREDVLALIGGTDGLMAPGPRVQNRRTWTLPNAGTCREWIKRQGTLGALYRELSSCLE